VGRRQQDAVEAKAEGGRWVAVQCGMCGAVPRGRAAGVYRVVETPGGIGARWQAVVMTRAPPFAGADVPASPRGDIIEMAAANRQARRRPPRSASPNTFVRTSHERTVEDGREARYVG